MKTRSILSIIGAVLFILIACAISYAVAPSDGTVPTVLYGAVLTGGILGEVKNKVGNVVAATWFNVNYVRAYVIPANPNTTAQQTQRTFFASVVNAAKLILPTVIQPYWDPFYTQYSGYNAFSSYNLNNMSAPFDYADMFVARGTLESETPTSISYDTPNIVANWSPAGLGNGEDTDPAILVVIDSANNIAFVSDGSDTRVDTQVSMNVGAGRTPADMKGWLFFTQGTGEDLIVSNSVFVQVSEA